MAKAKTVLLKCNVSLYGIGKVGTIAEVDEKIVASLDKSDYSKPTSKELEAVKKAGGNIRTILFGGKSVIQDAKDDAKAKAEAEKAAKAEAEAKAKAEADAKAKAEADKK